MNSDEVDRYADEDVPLFAVYGEGPLNLRLAVIILREAGRIIADIELDVPHEFRNIDADVPETGELDVCHEPPAAVIVHQPFEPLRMLRGNILSVYTARSG